LGLSNWEIHLVGTDGTGTAVHTHTTTGTGGAYSFTALKPGTYTLCETPQSGWVQTLPTTNTLCTSLSPAHSGNGYSLTLTSGQNITNTATTPTNFGNRQLFRLIILTCNDVSNTLVGSAVTLSGQSNATTIGPNPPGTRTQQRLCDETANPAGVANTGASYGNLVPGVYTPSVTIPAPTP
jgi:hypothetical protein